MEPKYLNAHLHPTSIIRDEKERVLTLKRIINHILDKHAIEFKSAFKYEMPKLREGITADLFKLSDAYLHCISELRTIETQEAKVLVEAFSDLECLDQFIYHYNKTKDNYYKNKIFTLTLPYIPEMKKLVLIAQKMFAEEETTLTLGSGAQNLFEDDKK